MPERRTIAQGLPDVAPLCLGGNVFGWGADEDRSMEVLEAFTAGGGNMVDSANIYSAWVPGNRGGESEAILGRWLAGRRDRDDLVIATKVGMEGGDMPKGLRRDQILRGADESLRRLDCERIDLYYAHEDDAETPLDETLAAFGELIDQGLVTAIAASNYPAPRLAEAMRLADEEGLPRYVALQPHYNLMDRSGYEGEVAETCDEHGLSVFPYFALARGFLAGKYRPGEPLPDSPRAPGVARDYLGDPRGPRVLEALDAVAGEAGASPAQVSLAWLAAQPGVVAPIASATTVAQVGELLGAMELELGDDQVARLTAASDPVE